jgi:hypothetical protein
MSWRFGGEGKMAHDVFEKSYLNFLKLKDQRYDEENLKYPQFIEEILSKGRLVGRGISKLIVECDGHDLHEKTKEQAKKEKAGIECFNQLAMTYSILRVLRFIKIVLVVRAIVMTFFIKKFGEILRKIESKR